MTENIKEIALRACDILDEKMGTDIVCLPNRMVIHFLGTQTVDAQAG